MQSFATSRFMNLAKSLGWWLAVGLVSFLGAVETRAEPADINLRAQLIWGTDGEKPKGSKCKDVEPSIRKKLERVFKWKRYYEIKDQRIPLGSKDLKRLKMSDKCELEVRFADENTLEIKLFGEGRSVKTIRQSARALCQGELAVLAGDTKENVNDAWFVVLTASVP